EKEEKEENDDKMDKIAKKEENEQQYGNVQCYFSVVPIFKDNCFVYAQKKNATYNIKKSENQVFTKMKNINPTYKQTKKKGKYKMWRRWWGQREEKEKTEIISKFQTIPTEQFGMWLLNDSKWKNEITGDDIDSIRLSVDAYLDSVMLFFSFFFLHLIDNDILCYLTNRTMRTTKKKLIIHSLIAIIF
ncbi:hypothetical protein RFI_12167, partial [Reticulomyxa filosa]